MLKVHTIKPARGAKHSKKRVGRGNASGHGTSSTRGGKGQTARSGGSRGLKMLGFKFLLQSTPKLRGFTSRQTKPAEVYLSDLEKHFDAGATITLAALQEKNLIGATVKQVKIVGTGELKKKVSLSGILATKGAAAAITKAGGDIK